MIKTEEFNNISFEPETLKPGERAVFKSVFGADNSFKSDHIMGENRTVINDPKFGPTEIAFVTQSAPKGKKPKLGTIKFSKINRGIISLDGNNLIDRLQFEYMNLADFNGSKPDRDPLSPAYYTRIDPQSDAKKRLSEAAVNYEATQYALNTELVKLKEDLATAGLNVSSWSEERIRDKALSFYKDGVIAPKKVVEGDDITPQVRELIEAGIIRWDDKEKMMLNVNAERHYNVPKLLKTTQDKAAAIVAYAKTDAEFMQLIKQDLGL